MCVVKMNRKMQEEDFQTVSFLSLEGNEKKGEVLFLEADVSRVRIVFFEEEKKQYIYLNNNNMILFAKEVIGIIDDKVDQKSLIEVTLNLLVGIFRLNYISDLKHNQNILAFINGPKLQTADLEVHEYIANYIAS